MNRLGVLEVNDALMNHFQRTNDIFVAMEEDIVPVYQMRSEHIVRDAIDKAFYRFIHDTVFRWTIQIIMNLTPPPVF